MLDYTTTQSVYTGVQIILLSLVRFIMRLGLLVDYFFIWQNVVISNVTSYDHKLEDVRTGLAVGAASTRLGYLGLPDTQRL